MVCKFKPLVTVSIALITLSKPPLASSSTSKPSGPYVNHPYAPAPKQIKGNRAYMAGVTSDRAYLTGEGK